MRIITFLGTLALLQQAQANMRQALFLRYGSMVGGGVDNAASPGGAAVCGSAIVGQNNTGFSVAGANTGDHQCVAKSDPGLVPQGNWTVYCKQSNIGKC